MSASQRNKGAAGEREVCALLRDWCGKDYTRNLDQVREGGADIHAGRYAIEVKRQERVSLPQWWEQATKQAGTKEPALWLRWSRGQWLVVITAAEFMRLAREEL